MSLKTLSKVSAVALVAAMAVGCASNSELEKVRQIAVSAQATANDAKAAADSAQQCCSDNSARISRLESSGVSKKSMYK